MNKRDKLLIALKAKKIKLELKKKRFELWQKEIEKKDERFEATNEELNKSTMWWSKQRRLEDRIEFVENKIREMERRNEKGVWVMKFEELINSIKTVGVNK